MDTPNNDKAPGIDVVLPYFVLATIAFTVMSLGLFVYSDKLLGHYYQPEILSLTHLIVLGWISMIIMGALYQLTPVLFEISLFSERLAKINFYIYSFGTIALIASFWIGDFGYLLSGSSTILFIGIAIFAVNILLSIKKASKSSASTQFIISSMIWLILGASMGLFMSLNHQFGFADIRFPDHIKIHAHLGILGWFLQLIIGVSSVLFPMFLVSHELNEKKLKISFYLINIGLVLLLILWFFPNISNSTSYLFISLIIAGILFHVSYLFDAYKNKLRKLDIGMLMSTLSLGNIALPILLVMGFIFLLISNQSISAPYFNIYGFSIFIGFITPLILGQTYKTLPFIIWLHYYQQHVGKKKVLMPADLFSENLAFIHMWTFIASIILLFAGMVIGHPIILKIGAALLFVTALLYLSNVLRIAFHKPSANLLESVTITKNKDVMELLKEVIDPEVEINIVDLGLIYDVTIEDKQINITMTLSTPSCPIGDSIVMNVMEIVQSSYPEHEINANLVFEPKWDPSRITDEGKKHLEDSHRWFS